MSDDISTKRVVWVSSSYGYDGDLMYFADLFREFGSRFPRGLVPVSRDFPVEQYPDLPLLPVLRFHSIGRTHRRVGAAVYTGEHRFLTLGSLIRLARLRPDVLLLIEFGPTPLAGGLVAALLRARTVLLVESDPSRRGAPGGRWVSLLKRLVGRRADAILVSNTIGREFVERVVRPDPDRLVVGPYLTSAPAAAPSGAPARPVEEGPRRLLFLNSLVLRKGILELVDALGAMSPAASGRWHLDVVGSGDAAAAVRDRVEELDLQGCVTFHGRVPFKETGPYYRRADLVVCPTLADYRSLSGFEAVNAGKPVLLSRYDGAHHEIAERAPGATVVDPLDRTSFARVIEEMLVDDEVWERVRAAAAVVPPDFTVPQAAANVEAAVRRALA